MDKGEHSALLIKIRGVVQGVGFRPNVYRIAHQHAVTGWVLNDEQGVAIHAEGSTERLNDFVATLKSNAPAAAKIISFTTCTVPFQGFAIFEIRSSLGTLPPTVRISADLPVCDECLAELNDPESRRYLYPYINCTLCGPRYSILKSLPYDRANTTMADWPLCDACRAEYENPRDRRYHAQPTACHECGPGYRLIVGGRTIAEGLEAIIQSVSMLKQSLTLAVKGIGGFHLACSADDVEAVQRLRTRKFRKEKPFALMARDLDTVHQVVHLSALHRGLLLSQARPIVLAPARISLPGVAENIGEFGVMLPYAPVHVLLFQFGAPNPLVMTSANRSSEPIAYTDSDAIEQLGGITDGFLIGDRPIARRVDDSVVAVRDGSMAMLRRSRGYAPSVVARLPIDHPILALGSDLKNAITLVVSGEGICSQHIGDLGDLETNRAFNETIGDLLKMYEIDARDLILAHDLHPQFVTTRFAIQMNCHQRIAVQHHRAHIASVMAEHGELHRPVVGIALDGSGYGDDGTIWGFEFFSGSVADGLKRVAHMRTAKLPGGDAAAKFPVQAAAGFLAELDLPNLRQPPFSFPERFLQAQSLVKKNLRCFSTTSAGRLFDTVAALCGFTRELTFEGQAAIWLEHLSHETPPCDPYRFSDLDYRPLLASVIADRLAGRDVGEISYAFHAAIARGIIDTAATIARNACTSHVALSGGVFQNRLLRDLLNNREGEARKLTFLYNQQVPANDGGISLGQAAFASLRGHVDL